MRRELSPKEKRARNSARLLWATVLVLPTAAAGIISAISPEPIPWQGVLVMGVFGSVMLSVLVLLEEF